MPTAALIAGYRLRPGGPPYPLLPSGETTAVTFPTSPLRARIYIAQGADLTADWHTWNWLDITGRVRVDQGVYAEVGRRDQFSIVSPGRAVIKIDNNDGYLSRRNPMSPYFGQLTKNTPIWIQLDPGSGFYDFYQGFVNEWPTRWADRSGTDAFVTIECSGPLRRLGQGRKLKSALFRSMSGVAAGDYVPRQYWPLEDGTETTIAASGVAGGVAMTPSGSISWGADSVLTGSQPLPTLDAGASLTAYIPAYTDTNKWVVQLVAKINSEPSVNTTLLEVETPGGSSVKWKLIIQPGAPSVIYWGGFDSAGVATASATSISLDSAIPGNPSEADFYGTWWFYTLGAYVDEFANVDATLSITDDGGITSTAIGFGPSGHASATTIRLYGASGLAAGHVGLFTDSAFDVVADAFDNSAAMYGYDGEQAHVRMARLCREEGVPFISLAARSALMGPQPSGTLLEVLRDAETTDQGILYEREFGLAYLSTAERYNRPVSMALNFDSGQISGMPEPSDDDQFTRNQVTASRPSGASGVVVEQTTGTMGTGVGGAGVWADAISANVATDAQLSPHAGWSVHLGTVDEDRWPSLPLMFHGSPELIPSWLAMPFGGRLTLANPPAQMAPDTIDATLEGHAQQFTEQWWSAVLNTSPNSPFIVGVAGDTTTRGSSAQAVGSTLGADITTTDVSLSVLTTAGYPVWTTTPVNLTIIIGGETMTVSAISGASSPQTFTVARSVNGVVKTHTAGETVLVYRPLVAAL